MVLSLKVKSSITHVEGVHAYAISSSLHVVSRLGFKPGASEYNVAHAP
jgi:hypothetical protein